MSRWYRAYEGTVTDAKLAEVALVSGCSRSVAIATWHAVLENGATLNDGGRIDIPSRRVAAILCEPFELIESVFLGFETVGLIIDSAIIAWAKRQYESDNSTERSRKHRATKRNADATLQQRDVTPPETETETETEVSEPKGSSPRAWICPLGVDKGHWRDFLKNRRTRHLTNSETAYKGQIRELDRLADDEWPPGRLVQHAAEKGWGSINDPRKSLNGNGHERPNNPTVSAVQRIIGAHH